MNNIHEVRRVRREMSQAAGHDIRRLIAAINETREKVTSRIISPGSTAASVQSGQPSQRPAPETSGRS